MNTFVYESPQQAPTLFVRQDLVGAASLELPLAGLGVAETDRIVELLPRVARLLVAMAEPGPRSAHGVPTRERGFLSRMEIARRMARLPGAGPAISETTVTEYVYKLRRVMDKIVSLLPEELRPYFELIEGKRGIGYRLGPCGLRVVFLDAESEPVD